MAEILLSLTIIGVVAAITLPSLTGNINERTWNTQRKALYARMSQAIALMPALNGYGTVDDTTDTAAETFITAGLSKVLKINNICDSEHLADCGMPKSIIPMACGNESVENVNLEDIKTLVSYNDAFSLNTKAAAFETQNGESILVYYNPSCRGSMGYNPAYLSQTKMCANFVYDLNGNKGPNTVGKDIGIIVAAYPSDSNVVAPMPLVKYPYANITQQDAQSQCKDRDTDSRLPNIEELSALFYNRKLVGVCNNGNTWSSTVDGSQGVYMNLESGTVGLWNRNAESFSARCIKR